MKARLAAYKNGQLTATFPLPEPGTTIGRDAENHICLEHVQVSRHHAAVHAKDGMWVLKDLGSTNGLTVNGSRVNHAVLKKGDEIRIGPFCLVFETISDATEWGPAQATYISTEKRDLTNETPPPGGPETIPRGD